MSRQTPAERLFTLTCCLLAAPRNGVSKQQLLLSVPGYQDGKTEAALDRMFERDKLSLKEAGVSLELIDGEGSENPDDTRYRIAPGSFSWPEGLTLNPVKLQLLELAGKAWNQQSMRESALSAITRLKALGYVEKGHELDVFSPRILARHASFAPLAQAIESQVVVRFDYQKADSEPSRRELSPLKLRYLEGQWILLALDGAMIKNFLLRRIVSEVQVTDISSDSVAPELIGAAELDLERFVQSQQVTIKLEPNSEAWWHFGSPEAHSIRFPFMDAELLVEDLLELSAGLRVESPESIKQLLARKLREVVANHA